MFKIGVVLIKNFFNFSKMKPQVPLVVFDFDHTLLDVNSDVEIQKLFPDGKVPEDLEAVNKEQGWNEFIRQILIRLHQNQVSRTDIEVLLRKMPLTPGVPEMLTRLKNEIDAKFIIVSDANAVFIREPLENANLFGLFEKIFTNPATFDDQGRLNMTPFTEQTSCKLCRKNLCKGDVLRRFIKESSTTYSFIAYVGDGPNDFCPMLTLGPSDLAFPRKDYYIEKVIAKKASEGLNLSARTISWDKVETITEAIIEKQLSS